MFKKLLGIDLPIIQAPMAGVQDSDLAIAVSLAGGLGSLPCGMLNVLDIELELSKIKRKTDKPFNINFFSIKFQNEIKLKSKSGI
jgi:nitronate monooxygenase